MVGFGIRWGARDLVTDVSEADEEDRNGFWGGWIAHCGGERRLRRLGVVWRETGAYVAMLEVVVKWLVIAPRLVVTIDRSSFLALVRISSSYTYYVYTNTMPNQPSSGVLPNLPLKLQQSFHHFAPHKLCQPQPIPPSVIVP